MSPRVFIWLAAVAGNLSESFPPGGRNERKEFFAGNKEGDSREDEDDAESDAGCEHLTEDKDTDDQGRDGLQGSENGR